MATTKEKITTLKKVVHDIEELFIDMDNNWVASKSTFYLNSMRRVEILNEMIKELESTIGE